MALTKVLARPVGEIVRRALRAAGSGGTSLPGRAALALDPDFLSRARAYPHRLLVTGTNGKTSTVAIIAALLRDDKKSVASNEGGANLRQGLATVLLRSPRDVLALEVDELTLPKVAPIVAPEIVVVTGFFRDQLDRCGEVASVRRALARALAEMPGVTLVLNGDDPLSASLDAPRRVIFRLTQPPLDIPADGTDCPRCGALLHYRSRSYAQLGEYYCPACGFAAPKADVHAEVTDDAFVVNGVRLPPLPHALHPYSALAALAALHALGFAVHPREWPPPVAGRGTEATIAGRSVTVVLGKNPASVSWNLARHHADAHLFLVNNHVADGRDVSWLWDINLAPVRRAIASGERALEMLSRLRYEPKIEMAKALLHPSEAFAAALEITPPSGRLLIVTTYTELPTALGLLRARTMPARSEEPRSETALPPRPTRQLARANVRIALLFPDQLGTYADGGNAVVLQRRLEWRGIACEVIRIGPDDALPTDIDVLLMGGGEDRGQALALEGLLPIRADLAAMLADGVPALLVCGGFQLLGQALPLEGEERAGLGLLPMRTERGSPRLVGRIGVASPLLAAPLIGFENHGGHTKLFAEATPLGEVLYGHGNAVSGSAKEGILLHHCIGTYVHGPVLARNPALAEVLLGWLAERRGLGPLAPLDDRIEVAAARDRA